MTFVNKRLKICLGKRSVFDQNASNIIKCYRDLLLVVNSGFFLIGCCSTVVRFYDEPVSYSIQYSGYDTICLVVYTVRCMDILKEVLPLRLSVCFPDELPFQTGG